MLSHHALTSSLSIRMKRGIFDPAHRCRSQIQNRVQFSLDPTMQPPSNPNTNRSMRWSNNSIIGKMTNMGKTASDLKCHRPQKNRGMKRDSVLIGNQKIGYYLYEYNPGDRYSPTSTAAANIINVFLPGHGQRAATAQQLLSSLAQQNPSQLTWSIDIDPSPGGSLLKTQALIKILEQMFTKHYPSDMRNNVKVQIFGWSQGGSEAMLAAAIAPEWITGIACICSTGLVQRSVGNLATNFTLECTRIFTDAARQRNGSFSLAIRLGLDITYGMASDVLSTRSIACAWEDLRDAARQVCGANYDYNGDVILIFAENDTVISWRDAFPGCKSPGDVQTILQEYRQRYFPRVRNLKVEILPGNHIAPEADAERYVQAACRGLDPLQRIRVSG